MVMHPSFRKKQVYQLNCVFCGNVICRRGMKAVLLADVFTELYSTDHQDKNAVDIIEGIYNTDRCKCKIQDVACLGCGNVIGYHVRMPCKPCLLSCNNGHFWMYYSARVFSSQRMNCSGGECLVWGKLPTPELDDLDDCECSR